MLLVIVTLGIGVATGVLLVIVTLGIITGAGAGVGGFYTTGVGMVLFEVVLVVVAGFPPHPFNAELEGELGGTKLFATLPC